MRRKGVLFYYGTAGNFYITVMHMQYTRISLTVKVTFQIRTGKTFLIFDQNIDSGYALEPS